MTRRIGWFVGLIAFAASPALAQLVQTNTFVFEAGSEPAIPSGWRSSDPPAGVDALWIVAFTGPVAQSWSDDLARAARVHSYLPDYAFLVSCDRAQAARLRAWSSVRAVQLFHPAYKVFHDLTVFAFGADDPTATQRVKVSAVDAAACSRLVAALEAEGAEFVAGHRASEQGIGHRFVAALTSERLRLLAHDARVLWVETFYGYRFFNNTAGVIMQCRPANTQPNNFGLTGLEQMVCVADTGLSNGQNPSQHNDFNASAAYTGLTPKIFASYPQPGCSAWSDPSCGHGTHVAGSVLGTGLGAGAGSGYQYRGNAPNAQLIVQDLEPSGCSLSCFPGSLVTLFNQAYTASTRARIHTNSWGGGSNGYNADAQDVDTFVAGGTPHRDMIVCFAAANSGPGYTTVSAPSTAKDCICVGASENTHLGSCTGTSGNPNAIAGFSSRGNTSDGRLKPDIVAPGHGVSSALTGSTGGYTCMSGTSMATPLLAGMCALVREYYQFQGSPTHTPNSSLVKATILNAGYWPSSTSYDNRTWGYGRADLQQAVYPPPPFTWRWEDEAVPLSTGGSQAYVHNATDGSVPVRITLAWSDPPGSVGCGTCLVNNLNLTVTSPVGTVFQGNHRPAAAGIVPGGLPDGRNNVEQVWVKPGDAGFATGNWTAVVSAANVPQGPQYYSIVASFGQVPLSFTPTYTFPPGFTPSPTSTFTPLPPSPTITPTACLFGYNVLGSSNSNTAGALRTTGFQLLFAATFTGCALFTDNAASGDQIVVGLYTDAGGYPGTKIAQSAAWVATASSWSTAAFPSTALSPGTYWLVFGTTSTQAGLFRLDQAPVPVQNPIVDSWISVGWAWNPTMPASYPAGASNVPGAAYSVYIFCASGPTPTPPPSNTPTISGTVTYTATITATRTITQTFTISLTPCRTVTATETRTFTFTPTPTETATPTSTETPTITPTPTASGPLVPMPNPVSVSSGSGLRFLNAPTDTVVRIYTVSGQRVATLFGEGVVAWDLTNDWGKPIAPGLYYFVADYLGKRRIQSGRVVVTP